jgi:type II secretory pathway component PulM
MDEISTAMAPLVARIDALSLRERLLVLITVLVLIAALWHTLLMQPLEQRASETRAELTALEDRITAANRSLEEQILQLAGGGDEQRLRIDNACALLHYESGLTRSIRPWAIMPPS